MAQVDKQVGATCHQPGSGKHIPQGKQRFE
jgi:hypothetical protein